MIIVKKIIIRLNKVLFRRKPFKIEVKCNYCWYGNSYGGFYVNPDSLNKNSIVYSFGIGEDISFDSTIIDNHNCQVFGFDPTPKSINWIKNQQLKSNFNFYNYGISNITGFVIFNLPKNKDYVSGSIINHQNVDDTNTIKVPMKSFDDIINELGHDVIDVLKMDIEGSEYDVIESILESRILIKQILIEIHERFFKDGRTKTKRLIKLLNKNGYKCFAISDSKEEISFIKI